jgi:hypothetical protein
MAMMSILYFCSIKDHYSKMEGMLNPEKFWVKLLQVDIEGGTTIEESANYLPQLFLVKELKHKTT